ncbi:hypothetical protein L226DRAFT_573487 [Lentinus tigrinus ALCF2SS1-7]|uniref:Uncharacterized protein n=1 Tax=Lentinus tigrinus ALCF2SS1-6 TaxID=1328759 RepID=A0A5C2S205_9APHY|nr:hypothetical protein L227DRAFT_613765 [Lentinus tigrinus ALCF2SS1-6]RPD72136.1 hypothetical protein L226DRAFT_573487 [Lentinus tigrinus ALCF2SS1-7]
MVRWRTACTVIVIIVGAALLTFAVYVYRRQKLMHRFANAPDMQQRFMHSYAGDPEAHMPLLNTEAFPPLPPKTEPATHHRNMSSMDWTQTHQRNGSSLGELNDWGAKVRGPPSRVPVPPMFPEPMLPAEQRYSFHSNPDLAITMPEPEVAPTPAPAPRSPLFHLPQISFPRIQIKTDGGKKGRIPSLRIEFLRESNQVISSPAAEGSREWAHMSYPASSVSAPSTNSRPFATMAKSPLPQIPRVSPIDIIDISRVSPSLPPVPSSESPSSPPPPESAVNSIVLSDVGTVGSVQDVGRNFFSRKLSTEDSSFQTVSRNSSAQAVSRTSSVRPTSEPGRPRRTSSTSSGSGSGVSSGRGTNLKRATTWVPNVLASYSPWHGVVPGTGGEGREPVESPTGQIRVADAYRPMPTLEETPEATPATIPTPLPGDSPGSPSYVAEDIDRPLPLPRGLAEMPLPPRPPELRPLEKPRLDS